MTNLVAAVLIVVATNSVEVGTLTKIGGERFTIYMDQWVTNEIAVFEWRGKMDSKVLASYRGPFIGERHVRKPPFFGQYPPMPGTNPMIR